MKKRPKIAFKINKDGLLAVAAQDESGKLSYIVYNKETKEINREDSLTDEVTGEILLPVSDKSNLVQSGAIILPTDLKEYENVSELVKEIRAHIHKYLEVSTAYEELTSWFVLFTWVFDDFAEVPYLRLIGDYGTGKSRGLEVIGSLCFLPIFAGGATTAAPIFRTIEMVGGTLIIDEADFQKSDTTADIVKILNSGNKKSTPVLRTVGDDYEPRAFNVFGPKIIATRHEYQDEALESRCLTETMAGKTRDDVPGSLSTGYKKERDNIIAKLLMFRFETLGTRVDELPTIVSIEPRLNQIIGPLLSIIPDEESRESLMTLIERYNEDQISHRRESLEGRTVKAVSEMLNSRPTMQEIAERVNELMGSPEHYKIGAKKIGSVVRRVLNLKTERDSRGIYLTPGQTELVDRLAQRYGYNQVDDKDIQAVFEDMEL